MTLFDYFRLFHPLQKADYQLLVSKLYPRFFKKGDYLTIPGQVQKELYFVKSGEQMSFFDAEEKIHVIAFTYAPNLCAIPESFSFQAPSRYYLTCLSDSEMESISFDDLQQLQQAFK